MQPRIRPLFRWLLPAAALLACPWPALADSPRFELTPFVGARVGGGFDLNNPTEGNTYPTVRTLVAAYQMVKAGETAKSHRHSANALRLVLDTWPNTFTIVGGKKIPMEPGDVLLTPNWAWHGHDNKGADNAYWIDFLDETFRNRNEIDQVPLLLLLLLRCPCRINSSTVADGE
jgi:hypothetical protein